MRTYQRGRNRKRRASMYKKFRDIPKRMLAFLVCFGIILTGMPTPAAFAYETGAVNALDDDGKEFTEDDTGFYAEDYDDEETDDNESTAFEETSDPDEDMTGKEEPDRDSDEDSDEDREYEDNEDTERDENDDTEYDDEDTGSEEDAETEDEDEIETDNENDVKIEDEEIDEEEVIGSAGSPVPSVSPATAFKTVTAKIFTDDSYDEVLSDGTTIELSGKMPGGAVVKAYPVEVEIEDITVLAAYDITIFDGDGEEYEPDEDDVIEVTIENDEIREALEEEIELTVLHMDDEEDEPEEIVRLPRKTKKARFRARHFSIYIVGTDDELYALDGETLHNVYILNFYLGDVKDPASEKGYYLLSTQTVSAGEKVEEPAVPDQDGYEFAGWFTEPGGGGEQYKTYNGVMPDMPEGTEEDMEIDLYAHYVEAYVVHYMTHAHEEGDEDTRVIFHTEEYAFNAPLYTKDAEDFYLVEGYLSVPDPITGVLITSLAVTGWLDENGNEWETGDPVSGSLNLYPVVEPAYWIYFDMNGHDSIENPVPEYVLATETYIGTLPEPKVSGYSFDGWYTEKEGGDKVTADSVLAGLPKNTDGSITLYAHWEGAKAAYTINIWRQKAIDGAAGVNSKKIKSGETYDDYIQYYDYAESHYVTAEQSQLYTGDIPTTSAVDNWNTYTGYGTTTDKNSAYYGFEYKNTGAQTRTLNELANVTMASDGSTIINIYYNRVTITWNFGTQSSSTAKGTLIGLYDTNVSLADNVVPGGTLSSWPANSNDRLWKPTYSGSVNTTFKAKFDIDGGYTTVSWRENNFTRSHYLYFYLEVTNEDTQVDVNGSKAKEASDYGVAYTRTVNGTLYVYNQRTGTSGGSFKFSDKYAGYYLAGYIDNRNGSTQTTYISASAGGSHSFTNDGYIFNNATTANTITLISSDKVVGVDAAGNAVPTSQSVTYPDGNRTSVKYAADMGNYPFPEELDGETWGPAYYYHFTGWYEDPSLTSPFSITTMPNSNVVAYADWGLNDITVTFEPGTSDVKAPDMQKIKAAQKAVDPGELERKGFTHAGWVDQNGKVFNFDTVLYKDTVLTAIWKADDESGYTILYDLNVDNSYSLFDGYTGDTAASNGEHFTEEEEVWTIEKAFSGLKDTDYEDAYSMFIGWNTASDGTGTMYYPDDVLTVNDSKLVINDGIITLYAVWAHRNESTLILFHNYPDGYVPAAGETRMDILTDDNLTSVDLASVSGLEYHHEITVEDYDGTIHTYRFDGWSLTDPGDDPTDEDVDIDADETVAADTLYTSAPAYANYLFAVWLEVHNITVTKEIVNHAENYKIPDDMTFTFNWMFTDGEGNEHTNEDVIKIKGGESFIIPDVASGESVKITETQEEGFTTSYNGAHTDVKDNGEGIYTFTMDDNSREITVYNTVDTTKVTVTKEWEDINRRIDVDHDPVTVNVSYGNESKSLVLSSENNWSDTVEFVKNSSAACSLEEITVNGYKTYISDPQIDGSGNISFTVINTETENPSLSVEKTADVEEGYKAKLGDTITYVITVKNDGNVTITDITVKDDLTGLKESIDSLAPGESKTYTTAYKVTEEDIEAGSIVNTATAAGNSPDGTPEDTKGTGESEINTEAENPSLSVQKTADIEEGYKAKLGDTITYVITVKNDGNVTITDITVKDDLTGLKESIDSLAPGESKTYTTAYKVTEEDIEAGSIVNTATATGSSPDGTPEDTKGSGDVTIDTEKPDDGGSGGGSGSGGSGSGGRHGGSSNTGVVRNVNTGKTGHWILEGGYLTLPDGSHPSNEYLDVDGEIWAFYTYGYAVAKRHTQYYTDEAVSAAGYIPEVTGSWETIGWWFEYDDGTYPHDEWALLEYNGLTYWYHFDVDGWMDDGWFYDKNGDTYYLDPVYDGWRGHMMTGWHLIGGYWYYFSEDPNSLGVMLRDTATPDGFSVDEKGRWIGD